MPEALFVGILGAPDAEERMPGEAYLDWKESCRALMNQISCF